MMEMCHVCATAEHCYSNHDKCYVSEILRPQKPPVYADLHGYAGASEVSLVRDKYEDLISVVVK